MAVLFRNISSYALRSTFVALSFVGLVGAFTLRFLPTKLFSRNYLFIVRKTYIVHKTLKKKG